MVGLLMGLLLMVQVTDTLDRNIQMLHDSLETSNYVSATDVFGQEDTTYLRIDDNSHWPDGFLYLQGFDHWYFKEGNDSTWADPELDISDWEQVYLPTIQINREMGRKFEGWFRLKFQVSENYTQLPSFLNARSLASAFNVYLDGEFIFQCGKNTDEDGKFRSCTSQDISYKYWDIKPGQNHTLAIHVVAERVFFEKNYSESIAPLLYAYGESTLNSFTDLISDSKLRVTRWITALTFMTLLLWFMFFLNRQEKTLLIIAIVSTTLWAICFLFNLVNPYIYSLLHLWIFDLFRMLCVISVAILFPVLLSQILTKKNSLLLLVCVDYIFFYCGCYPCI